MRVRVRVSVCVCARTHTHTYTPKTHTYTHTHIHMCLLYGPSSHLSERGHSPYIEKNHTKNVSKARKTVNERQSFQRELSDVLVKIRISNAFVPTALVPDNK